MKKLFSVAVAVLLALCMSICVFAADEIEIPLDAEHVGASSSGGSDALTIENGTLTANDIALFSLVLPENVPLGDTVVVHLKGTSDGDFRVWLLGAGETDEKGSEATFSNQWKRSASTPPWTRPSSGFSKPASLPSGSLKAVVGSNSCARISSTVKP